VQETDAWVGSFDPAVRPAAAEGGESAKSDARVASRVVSEQRREESRRRLAGKAGEYME